MAPKMSKAEKKAAAEAAAAAAEAARIAEEERLEKERQAVEAALAEEQKARDEQEKQLLEELEGRLEEEHAANAQFDQERSLALASELAASMAGKEWDAFVACGELPSVTIESDVNTWLAEWADKPREGAEHLDQSLAQCTLCAELLQSLQYEEAFAASRGDAKQAAWQFAAQLRLREELLKKLDGATADFLQRADEFVNAKNECVVGVASEGCRYGLWVNLAKNPRIKSIDFAELSVTSELPKTLALASIAVRVVHYSADVCSPYAPPEAKGAATYVPLGGVLNFELLSLPPLPKKIKGWTMRPVTEMTNSVVHVQYPMPNADGVVVPGSAPPLRISFLVPATCLLPPNVECPGDSVEDDEGKEKKPPRGFTVGWWDAATHRWSTDDVFGVEYSAETRTVSFQTTRLTSLALLQPCYLEFPYKRWLYTPTSASSGLLHLETHRSSLTFAVGKAGAALVKSGSGGELPQLEAAGLLNVYMPPTTLLHKLAACGIVLTPKDDDAASLPEPITPKSAELENEVFEALAPLLARYQLAPSRWNQSRGPKKCTIRLSAVAAESYDAADDDADGAAKGPANPYDAVGDWPTMEYVYRRVMMIAALDSDATCNDAALHGGVAHSTPLECLKADDPEAVDVLNASSRLFQDSARQLFSTLRLLSFTAASSGLTQ